MQYGLRVSKRDYKNLSEGEYYHIFNRGTGHIPIFKDDSDYVFFLKRLKENLFPDTWAPSVGDRYERKQLPRDAFTLVCYCLMPNHFHFLLRQNTDLSIGTLMGKVCGGYSKYFNKKYQRVGSVFQDQFKAAHVDNNAYLLWLSAYIHQNPKVAGLVDDLNEFRYSSYLDYVGERGGLLCDRSIIEEQFGSIAEYRTFVDESYEVIRRKKEMEHLLID